jgi:hypothetical protein
MNTINVTAKLSNGLTLSVDFISPANAHRAAARLIKDYAAEGVSVTSLVFTQII